MIAVAIWIIAVCEVIRIGIKLSPIIAEKAEEKRRERKHREFLKWLNR